MKVIGTTPSKYYGDFKRVGVIAELTNDEWHILAGRRKNNYGDTIEPTAGTEAEICARFRELIELEKAVAIATSTPNQLRGMADALDAVVDAAKKAITPPPDESVPLADPSKL